MKLSWCLATLACHERVLTPIFATSIAALLHKEEAVLLQPHPFLTHNLNLSSVNQELSKATFQCVLLSLVTFSTNLSEKRKKF